MKSSLKGFVAGFSVAGAIGYGAMDHYRSERDQTNTESRNKDSAIENLNSEIATTRGQLRVVTQQNSYNTYLATKLTARQRTEADAQYTQEQTALAERLTRETRNSENERMRTEYENCRDTFIHNPTVEEHIRGEDHCFYANSNYTVTYDPTTHSLVATRPSR